LVIVMSSLALGLVLGLGLAPRLALGLGLTPRLGLGLMLPIVVIDL